MSSSQSDQPHPDEPGLAPPSDEPSAAEQPPPDEPNQGGEPEKAEPPAVSLNHVLATVAVLVTLVVVLLVVAWRWKVATDATAVLAVIIPSITAIGAAIYGIPQAYEKGKESGAEKGKNEGSAAGRSEGTKDGRRQVAREIRAMAQAGTGRAVVASGASGQQAVLDTIATYVDDVLAE